MAQFIQMTWCLAIQDATCFESHARPHPSSGRNYPSDFLKRRGIYSTERKGMATQEEGTRTVSKRSFHLETGFPRHEAFHR